MQTPRMSEVQSRIIRAAVALFSRQGFHGTSTRDISRLANISEVTIYRYFECKGDIFMAGLNSSLSNIETRLSLLNKDGDHRPPEAVVPEILALLIDVITFSPELTRLIAIALLEVHGKAEDICYAHLVPLFTAISNYLAIKMESGSLRSLNPAIVTAAMALSVAAQPELSNLIEGCDLSRISRGESVTEHSKFWLAALAPLQQRRAQPFIQSAQPSSKA